jgi:hypothetical protein
VTIPANTTGWLSLTTAEAAKYKLDGAPLSGSKLARETTRNNQSGFELAPDSYSFQVHME